MLKKLLDELDPMQMQPLHITKKLAKEVERDFSKFIWYMVLQKIQIKYEDYAATKRERGSSIPKCYIL